MAAFIEQIKKDKDLLYFIFGMTFLFGLLAHAHSYFNLFFNFDSLWLNVGHSGGFLRSVGRFAIPMYTKITGGLTIPFINGVLSLFFIACAVYLLAKILEFKSKINIALTALIFATAPILAFSNASFIFFSDVYMLALLLAVLAVYIFKEHDKGYIYGIIPLLFCLGLYQSYIQVAAVLLLILIIKSILDSAHTHTHTHELSY